VKQSRLKPSDTATYLQQKPKFKSRQAAGGFRADFSLLLYPSSSTSLVY